VPEVGGDAVLYIEPEGNAVEQMQQHIRTVTSAELRGRLIDAGQRQATHFGWDGLARSMMQFLTRSMAKIPASSKCRLCGHATHPLFKKLILGQYEVEYQNCPHCGASQTETPYWMETAHAPANQPFDTGQVTRSLINAAVVSALMRMAGLTKSSRVVDYGCGSGLLVRTLRDTGINAWGHDRYSSPRLALGFQTETLVGAQVVNLCEVVQQFDQPRQAFDELFAGQPQMVIIQTGVQPDLRPDWEYLSAEHGQHIFFLSPRTLQWLGETYQRKLLIVSGFIVLLKEELAQKLLDPGTGTLRAEHQSELGNILPQLWMELFAAPYRHASQDQQLLKQEQAVAA
jgi:hypothetical protein